MANGATAGTNAPRIDEPPELVVPTPGGAMLGRVMFQVP